MGPDAPAPLPDIEDMFGNALRVVSAANMADTDTLMDAANRIEKNARNGYYDDDAGCALLLQIVKYLRDKAAEP